jgi:hypothetical protein
MKKMLGVVTVGLALSLAGAMASSAQTTGGAGGAGGPGNSDTAASPAAPMKDSGSTGGSMQNNSSEMNKAPMNGNNGSPASQYPSTGGTTK